jgi:hypothetical protein
MIAVFIWGDCMKYIFSFSTFLLFSVVTLTGQKVDSIKVDQTGDLIKIHYKILDSNPNQVFRVSLLCSINGGLKSQLNSLSGDYGENVIGGRSGYMILWDVLKDVDELAAAEFFIKAELVKDLTPGIADDTFKARTKGKFVAMLALEVPGPKVGVRIGYLGSFGFSAQVVNGKIPLNDSFKEAFTDDRQNYFGVSLDLTKRIINTNSFQMHVIGGYINHDFYFYYPGPPSPAFWRQGDGALEIGMLFAANRLTGSFMVSHFKPGITENGIELDLASPVNFLSTCIGIRF